ncbi:MAG: Gfo/Idh/MocA family oxidoreductase [Bryobacterales bacterium]|nr:Gfo/Idh/MocA family oxidoreductase [Bryobacterales bacterium]
MKRRIFLGASLAAAATPLVKAQAASDQVNLAIVGVGGRGSSMINEFRQVPGVAIKAVCDVDQAAVERAMAAFQKFNLPKPRAVTDLRRVLDDKEIDAVSIATPDHWHAPATILACAAGKDVYCEKPASHNIREGRLMIDAARSANRIVQVGTQSRSRPSTVRAVEYAKSGKIGKIVMAKAWNVQLRDNIGHKEDGPVPPGVDYETWLGAAPWIPFNENRFHYKWHWHWHFGTGDAGNDGAHQLDIARWALGVSYPKSASGWGRKVFFDDDQQTPDSMNVTFDYGDKALIWEMRIWNPYGMDGTENGVAVYGTDGMVHIGRYNRKWGFRVFDKKGGLVHEDVPSSPESVTDPGPHETNFIECVRSRKLPNADIGIGHISAIHSHLANIVSRTGRNLRFDQESETITGDADANLFVSRKYRTHWSTPTIR